MQYNPDYAYAAQLHKTEFRSSSGSIHYSSTVPVICKTKININAVFIYFRKGVGRKIPGEGEQRKKD